MKKKDNILFQEYLDCFGIIRKEIAREELIVDIYTPAISMTYELCSKYMFTNSAYNEKNAKAFFDKVIMYINFVRAGRNADMKLIEDNEPITFVVVREKEPVFAGQASRQSVNMYIYAE